MDPLHSFAISAAGMAAERTRVEVAALNLANAHTAFAGEAGFRPLRAVLSAVGPGVSASQSSTPFARLVGQALQGPSVRIEPADLAPRLVREPGHPLADANGMVRYPAVDAATEMVTLMSATRAYEANVAALVAARTVALKTLEIGGGS